MESDIIIKELEQSLKKQNLIYSKYAGIAEGIQETLIDAILELEEGLGFTKDKRIETVEEIQELTLGILDYLKDHADDIESPKS